MSLQKHKGSCHCGAVKFEVTADLSLGTVRCNCTFCRKSRFWGLWVKPEQFTLLAGSDSLVDYHRAGKPTHLPFCKTCGVRAYAYGDAPGIGKFVEVNPGCLDDVTPEQLMQGAVKYSNGRDDDWMNAPAYTAHL